MVALRLLAFAGLLGVQRYVTALCGSSMILFFLQSLITVSALSNSSVTQPSNQKSKEINPQSSPEQRKAFKDIKASHLPQEIDFFYHPFPLPPTGIATEPVLSAIEQYLPSMK